MTSTAKEAPAKDRKLAKSVKDSKAPAISRAAAILRLLGRSDRPLGLQTIARELGLVPSTCLYVLRTLVAEEFVAFDPDTKRYSLEAGVLTLARQWLRRNQFTELAQPVLDRISSEFDVTMLGVNVVGEDHLVVVAISRAGNNLQISAQVGARFPSLISATGRCIAACSDFSEEELAERFAQLRWEEPPSFEQWLEEVRQTKVQGYAVDPGNYIAGVTVVAAPVWKAPGQFTHALVALGLGSSLVRSGLDELAQRMVAAAEVLSAQLVGEGG
ncbi:IclR family transcriptional regulator [Mangrovimicrobium sediminis]|uniref:HTH-type transcriptional repressor AllR n=1 Tax=Mangrovimicrobium sediminis TaxID=2562682 RepID=A0A4Z0LUS3_9GAMM|nr:IclR family transcriptional regulator [Haliea sp. SAOS-164]TGD71041.1 IclR family transcriptional regulator [Haliea sp. SAOS-164]